MAGSSTDANTAKKEKKEYIQALIEKLKKFQKKEIDSITFDLTKITIKLIIALIKENTHDIKLGFKLDNNTTYFLNDKVINELLKNKIEDEHLPDGNRKDNEYQQLVKLTEKQTI